MATTDNVEFVGISAPGNYYQVLLLKCRGEHEVHPVKSGNESFWYHVPFFLISLFSK